MSIAICPGSFNPMTLGHLNIVRRTSHIFDRVIVLIMVNANKRSSRPMTACWPSTQSSSTRPSS